MDIVAIFGAKIPAGFSASFDEDMRCDVRDSVPFDPGRWDRASHLDFYSKPVDSEIAWPAVASRKQAIISVGRRSSAEWRVRRDAICEKKYRLVVRNKDGQGDEGHDREKDRKMEDRKIYQAKTSCCA